MLSIQKRENDWKNLCEQYLPFHQKDSIWRSSREYTNMDAFQGWKLHITATIESCIDVLNAVAPLLKSMNVLYKTPVSIAELKKLNCGLFYGYSQIGKFITVYPRGIKEARLLAEKLYKLTEKYSGPTVPFNKHYKGLIYYRYGAFTNDLTIQERNNKVVPAIRDDKGNLVPDSRNNPIPDWLDDIFEKIDMTNKDTRKQSYSPISTTIKVFEAISQRGKGGVYKALHLDNIPSTICILKEGRKFGEVDWDNRDGYWRIKHEVDVLNNLSSSNIYEIPQIIQSFEEHNNYYAVIEFIEGKTLHELLYKKVPIEDALNYSLQIVKFMMKIHRLGWAWRDCKPLNFIVTPEEIIRPIDFEGACKWNELKESPWGTTGYIPPEWSNLPCNYSFIKQDLFALGATIHHIFSSKIPTETEFIPIGKLRRNIPKNVRTLISQLLNPNPEKRPSAIYAKEVLETTISSITKSVENVKVDRKMII